MKATLLIMAAGMGSRYGGLKQLDRLGPSGETLLEYSVFDAIAQGFTKVVFIIKQELQDIFNTQIWARFKHLIEVDCVFQDIPVGRVKPWGTGEAVLRAKDAVDGPFVVINADDFYGPHAFHLAADFYKKNQDEYGMVGYPVIQTLSPYGGVSRGICRVDRDGYLKSIKECIGIRLSASGELADENEDTVDLKSIASMNFWMLQESIFAVLESSFKTFRIEHANNPAKEFYLPAVIDSLIQNGLQKIRVCVSENPWFGITYKDDKDWVQSQILSLVQKGVYPSSLWTH